MHYPQFFELFDEWYNFQANPRAVVNVLISLDESTYSPGSGAMGDHPISWYHEFDGGRSQYISFGHLQSTFYNEDFQKHYSDTLDHCCKLLRTSPEVVINELVGFM